MRKLLPAAGFLLLLAAPLHGVTVTSEELTERQNWVAARFEGRSPPPRTDPALVVFANHGPVLKNARAGKPLRLGTQEFARGLLCHAPSRVLVRLPGPADTFTALVGIDSNEQTSGGRGSVEFCVLVGGAERHRSGVLREGQAAQPLRVELSGATEFVIRGDETADGIASDHADWVLRAGQTRLVNLGNADAWKWTLERIDRLLTSEAIDVYRQDFNLAPLECWRAADTPERQGLTETHHVEGYLAFWDELLRRHRGLLIDTCASGGRRNDLETLRRSVPLLRSDYPLLSFTPVCSEGQQCQTLGLSLWMPYHGTGMPLSDAYSMRSAFVPAYRLGWDVRDRKADLALLRRTVAEFREAEEYLLGDFYPLAVWSLAKDVWAAWQYDLPERGEGLVQAFRREESPYETARFRLRGLDADARYVIRDLDHPKATRQFPGRELMQRGLPVTLTDPRSSALLTYRRLPAAR